MKFIIYNDEGVQVSTHNSSEEAEKRVEMFKTILPNNNFTIEALHDPKDMSPVENKPEEDTNQISLEDKLAGIKLKLDAEEEPNQIIEDGEVVATIEPAPETETKKERPKNYFLMIKEESGIERHDENYYTEKRQALKRADQLKELNNNTIITLRNKIKSDFIEVLHSPHKVEPMKAWTGAEIDNTIQAGDTFVKTLKQEITNEELLNCLETLKKYFKS